MWENVKYSTNFLGEVCSITAEKDGWTYCIPMNEDLPEYREIMRLVNEGKLTIAPAEQK